MNIFMLGWEFPPFISGGLGTACYGLTKAMSELGHHVIFVLPQPIAGTVSTHVTLKTPTAQQALAAYRSYTLREFQNVEFRAIPSTLQPYVSPDPRTEAVITGGSEIMVQPHGGGGGAGEAASVNVPMSILSGPRGGFSPGQYGGDMFGEAQRYAEIAVILARGESFDVVHAHDWMTYPAGIAVARALGKPLVVHIHSTEFDRSGEHVNQRIYDVEREGMHAADRVIAVSTLTKNIVTSRYGVPEHKVEVVYNAIDNNGNGYEALPPIGKEEKIVLFLGRITMQKGPEYFLAAAKKVLEFNKNVRFVMAGTGDMTKRMIELAAELGIGQKVVFTGFLRGNDVARIYKMADLYVMPSVSEPFGIAPLEALSHDVPVLISKQSGVSEVLTHVLKVDFWDINEMANKIVAVLRHPPLQATLREHGNFEIQKLTWKDSAQHCVDVYNQAIAARKGAA
ncbi:MAG: 4-alpha-glucanotransferase [Planctomycetota bacterium]|nr:MAG: 4-alpha-glucanotransferase [Planctomycetota bacterium]